MAHVITFTSLPRWVRQGDAVPLQVNGVNPTTWPQQCVRTCGKQVSSKHISRELPGWWMQWFVGLSFFFVLNYPPGRTSTTFFFLVYVWGSFFLKLYSKSLKVNRFVRRMEDLSFLRRLDVLSFGKTHEQCSVHPRWLGSVGDEMLPSYEMCYKGIIINQKYKKNIGIPINQPGFHGMPLVGFDHCSHQRFELVDLIYTKSHEHIQLANYYFLGSWKLQKWMKSVKTLVFRYPATDDSSVLNWCNRLISERSAVWSKLTNETWSLDNSPWC